MAKKNEVKKFAIVKDAEGIISKVEKELVSTDVTVLEECDELDAEEKLLYWDKINHPEKYEKFVTEETNRLKYHFYSPILKRHVYTHLPDIKLVPGLRKKWSYQLVEDK